MHTMRVQWRHSRLAYTPLLGTQARTTPSLPPSHTTPAAPSTSAHDAMPVLGSAPTSPPRPSRSEEVAASPGLPTGRFQAVAVPSRQPERIAVPLPEMVAAPAASTADPWACRIHTQRPPSTSQAAIPPSSDVVSRHCDPDTAPAPDPVPPGRGAGIRRREDSGPPCPASTVTPSSPQPGRGRAPSSGHSLAERRGRGSVEKGMERGVAYGVRCVTV